MAFVPVINGAKVTIEGTQYSQPIINTFYFTHPTGWDEGELQALVDVIDPLWETFVQTYVASTYNYVRTYARDMRAAVGVQAVQDDGARAGGVSSAYVPSNVALAVARLSGFVGRSARGRIFLAGIPDTQIGNGSLVSSTFANAAIAALDAIDAAAAGVDWTEVIASFVQGGVPLTTAVVYTVASWAVKDLVSDSMRRRLPGRG